MQTFAKKQNQPQQPASSRLAQPDVATPERNHREHPAEYLWREIGSQAVQRTLQTDAGEHEAELTATVSPLVGQDFSRIPIHPPIAGVIQTKLAINKPGDVYEQEADRVAEQMMRIASPGNGTRPTTRPSPPLVQRRVSETSDGVTDAPPIVHEVLASSGQPLDAVTRSLMEPRFGHDFSRVRVHSGAAAKQSAQDLDARAYTVGYNIVFNSGGFAPRTDEGQRLLAHELTHVIQQSPSPQSLILMRTPNTPTDVSNKPPVPKPGHTPFNFISESPALGNWNLSVKEMLEREFKTKFATFEEAQEHFRQYLRSLPSDSAREDFADRMRDRARKAFFRQEARNPSYAYDSEDIRRMRNGAAPSGEMQLEHMEEVKSKNRGGTLIQGHPERALDPANIYITEGGPGGTAPLGTKHAEKQRTIEAAKKTSREIRDKTSKATDQGEHANQPAENKPGTSSSKGTPSSPAASENKAGKSVGSSKKSGSNIDLLDFPPDGEGPIAGRFKDGSTIRTLTTTVTTLTTAISLGTNTDISALGWVESHFDSEIDEAAKELQSKYPEVATLRSESGLDQFARAYDASISQLNAPSNALVLAEVGVLAVSEKDREAYIRSVRQYFANTGGGQGRWQNYLDAGSAYTEAIFNLQERLGDAPWELPKITADIDRRASVLLRAGNQMEQVFYSLMQSPAIAIPVVYYELFELEHVANVLKNLGARLNGLSAQINSRANDYQRLWDQLQASLNKVSKETEKLANRYHMKAP